MEPTLRQAATDVHPEVMASLSRASSTPDGHWDELRDRVAPSGPESPWASSWDTFVRHLGSAKASDLDDRFRSLQREVRDNGITYNVYADQSGPQRPWSLDLFPLMLEPAAWQQIETGVLQRVRLLEKVMADAYGPQRLLREGLLPAALIQGHPDYLPEMAGVPPVGGHHLSVAAFDLTRGPDGRWWVISQRTQAPSGLGYLLENRIIVSRLFQDAFESMPVQRLARAYSSWIESIRQRSPAGENAHIALLTPGPYNETYFEHAYLARYLGVSLVQGADLTVRDNRVYLKTLHGLQQVHGIIKRVDDQWMDPLEQRPDSTLGIPGLLQAIRAGQVLVANTPGSGFLESGALLGFMPALSQALLDEPLALPAAPTWWMGERAVRTRMLPELAHYVIKPTYPSVHGLPGFEPVVASTLTQSGLQNWQRAIEDHPEAYTLQAPMPLAHMPTWQNSTLEPRVVSKPYMLRVYALADGVNSWRVLPGGLARLGTLDGIASMQRGGSSADVWTLASSRKQVDGLSLLGNMHASAPGVLRQRIVTSRAAENLFWMGRYSERAENTLRLTLLTLDVLHGEDAHQTRLVSWLEGLCRSQGLVTSETPSLMQSRRAFVSTLTHGLSDALQGTGVAYNLRSLQDAAASLRERISSEHWSLIVQARNTLEPRLALSDMPLEQALQQMRACNQLIAAITGAQTDRMTRDDGWRLLSIGRHIERLDFLSQAWLQGLQENLITDNAGVDALVNLFDSTITFHSQYQQNRSLTALLDVLLLSQDNPRSLGWVLKTMRRRLLRVAENQTDSSPGAGLAAFAAKLPLLDQTDALTLCADGRQPTPELLALLQDCCDCSRELAQFITANCFLHAGHIERSVSL